MYSGGLTLAHGLDGLHNKPSSRVDDHDTPPPVDDGWTALSRGRLLLHQSRPLQVDDEARDQSTPEPAGCVGHLVSPPDTVDRVRHDSQVVLCWFTASERRTNRTPLRDFAGFSVDGRRVRGRGVREVDGRPLHGQHARDESLIVAQRQSNLEALQELEILREVFAGEPATVVEDECHVGLLQNAVVDKVLSLGHGDHLGQEVSQPDWVNEVEVVETSEMVVVVEENSVVMEKLSSCGGGGERGSEAVYIKEREIVRE